jgi:hypothetical protein
MVALDAILGVVAIRVATVVGSDMAVHDDSRGGVTGHVVVALFGCQTCCGSTVGQVRG